VATVCTVGLALGAGSGLIALVLGATVANRWFEHRRGWCWHTDRQLSDRAVAVPAAGAWLIEHHGWRVAVTPIVSAACSSP